MPDLQMSIFQHADAWNDLGLLQLPASWHQMLLLKREQLDSGPCKCSTKEQMQTVS